MMQNDHQPDLEALEDLLHEKLDTISTDDEFHLCIYSMVCDYPEDMQQVIDFIDEGEDVNYENVVILAGSLCQDHQPDDYFED